MKQASACRCIGMTARAAVVALLLLAATCVHCFANDFHGFIQAAALPSEFTSDFEVNEPKFLVVRKKGSSEFDAIVISQRGTYHTYPSRVRAIDALANVACQSLKKNGYKVRRRQSLEIYDDLTTPKDVTLLFSRKDSNRSLTMRFWFQPEQAFCAAAHGLDENRHGKMLEWISSIDASQSGVGEPVRFWQLEGRRNTPAQLRWWKDDQIRLALGGGRVLDVSIASLSPSDRRYVERSATEPISIEDTKLGFALTLPMGFGVGMADEKNTKANVPAEFIHLDGTSIRIRAVPSSRLSNANVANVLRTTPAAIQVLDDTSVDIRFSDRQAKGASRRAYVAFVGKTSLVIEATAQDEKKKQYHWSKIEEAVRALHAI